MPARVRSERQSLSNCANAASTPSINFPVDVSSIGSVADRREIPRDFRCARSAKWSYLSREARQVEDDDELDGAFVRAAELQKLLQFSAIGSLRALPFLAESREHFEALALAVVLAGLQLRRQTEVLRLLLGADAHVDHCADHVRQHRSGVRRSQVRAHALVNRRALLVDEHLDHGLSYGVGVAVDSLDLVVGQIDRSVVEQFATPLDRN